MAIKIPGTLVPSNPKNFKVADARHIAFTDEDGTKYGEYDNLFETVKKIYDDVMAEPQLQYNGPASFNVPTDSAILLKCIASSKILGNLTVRVDRKLSSEADSTYQNIYTKSLPQGPIEINLGLATGFADYTYKVTVTDLTGSYCKYDTGEVDSEQNAITQDYILFRVVTGSMILTSSFRSRIFGTDDAEIVVPYQINTEITAASNAYIYYEIVGPGGEAPNGNLSGRNAVPILKGSGDITVQTGLVSGCTAGEYRIYIQATQVVGGTQQYSNTAELRFTVLEANSISTSIMAFNAAQLNTTSYLSVDFKPLTSIFALQASNSLLTTVKIYPAKTNGKDFEPDTSKAPVFETSLVTSHDKLARCGLGIVSVAGVYALCLETAVGPNISIGSAVTKIAATPYIFTISEYVGPGSEYFGETGTDAKELVFYFNKPMDAAAGQNGGLDNNNCWRYTAYDETNSSYFFKFTSDKVSDIRKYDENGSPVISLASGTSGVLYRQVGSATPELFNPWELLKPTANNLAPGFTFECAVKGDCIGVMDARIISGREDDPNSEAHSPGLSVGFEDICMDFARDESRLEYPLQEGQYYHIAFVVDSSESTEIASVEDLENFNPYLTARIYLNGTLIKVSKLSSSDNLTVTAATDLFPFILNGASKNNIGNSYSDESHAYPADQLTIESSGKSEIRFMRCYRTGLTSYQVYNNYLNYIQQFYGTDEVEAIDKKSTDGLTKIFFVKNKNAGNPETKKDTFNTTFDSMHKIKIKKGTAANPGSKNAYVNCTMYWSYLGPDGETIIADKRSDVDVWLQGTSSLSYPVKNYQIKVYTQKKGERKKDKSFYPPGQSPATGWYSSDYVYTLKCDYMEQSHRNNTPTACYYEDHVLPKVVEFSLGHRSESVRTTEEWNKVAEDPSVLYSPARRIKYENTENSKYRDAINGFPCVVFYCDNDSDTDLNPTNFTAEQLTAIEGASNYAGSYMFNVDKEGLQLGFEIEIEDAIQAGVISADDEHLEEKLDEDGEPYLVYKTPYTNSDGEKTFWETEFIPCISYEGATNDNLSAAAFVSLQSLAEAQKLEPVYKLYVEQFYQEYQVFLIEKAASDSNFNYCKDFSSFFSTVREDGSPSFETSYIEPVTQETIYVTVPETLSYTAWVDDGIEVYDYIKQTLEPRSNYAEDLEEEDEDAFKELTYSPMDRAIEWVYANCENEKEFKKGFNNYFSFEYCLAYYLQMMYFAQVDNAGKNAMFDVWVDGRLFPRPYDMDTQMGEDNTGQDVKPPSAELNPKLSPTEQTSGVNYAASIHDPNGGYHNPATMEKDHRRYNTYNTAESKLWIAFGTFFKTEILKCYEYLRTATTNNGIVTPAVYDPSTIQNYIDSKTYNLIGERFYNRDATAKYLSYKTNSSYDASYLYAAQGNRHARYLDFLTKRTSFLDTFFAYNSTDNQKILLRLNAPANTNTTVPIGISVYTPQYVTIDVDAGNQARLTAFIDPTDTYIYNNKTYNGVMFNVPLTGGDKNINISGAGNIRQISHLENLQPSYFQISPAYKLTEIVLTNATKLSTLVLDQNTYLRKLQLTGAKALASNLNLSKCYNLISVNLSNSKVPGLSLPTTPLDAIDTLQVPLAELKLTNSTIEALVLENLPFLDLDNKASFDISGCTSLKTFSVIGCSNLTTLDLKANTKLQTITLEDCANLQSVNLQNLSYLSTLSFSTLPKLETLILTNAKGTALKNLNLSSLHALRRLNLQSIKVSNSETDLARVLLPIEIDSKSGKIIPHTFYELNLAASRIDTLGTDAGLFDDSNQIGWYNFENIRFEGELTTAEKATSELDQAVALCGKRPLKFWSHNSSTPNHNTYVKKIKGLVYDYSLNQLFYRCSGLQQVLNCLFTPKARPTDYNKAVLTEDASSIFSECGNLTSVTLQSKTNMSAITSMASAFYSAGKIDLASTKGFLTKAPNVTNVSNYMCLAHSTTSTSYAAGKERTLPRDFFKYNPQITNMQQAFYGTNFIIVEHGTGECRLLSYYDSKEKIWKALPNLTNVANLFCSCGSLRYVPADIFKYCPNISTAAMAFYGCSNLGASWTDGCPKPSDYGAMPCIMSNSFSGIFYNHNIDTGSDDVINTEVLNIDGMFFGCSKIFEDSCKTSGRTWNPQHYTASGTSIRDFFKEIPMLYSARAAFYGCTWIPSLPEKTFEDNAYLSNLDFTFMNVFSDTNKFCGTVVELPEQIFSSLAIHGGQNYLTYARGLFAGCTRLRGIVSSDFFKGCTRLKYIGGAFKGEYNYTDYTGTTRKSDSGSFTWNTGITSPGMFGNTGISGFNYDFLDPLIELRDCSMLFYAGKLKSGKKADNNRTFYGGGTMTLNTPTDASLSYIPGLSSEFTDGTATFTVKGKQVTSGGTVLNELTDTSYIPYELFENCSNLINVSGMFAGQCGITGLAWFKNGPWITKYQPNTTQDFVNNLPVKGGLFKNNSSLQQANSLFSNCTKLEKVDLLSMFKAFDSTTGELKGLANLFDISSCFANTKIGSSTVPFGSGINYLSHVLEGCTSLRKCSALFMNTNIGGTVPADFFESCRGTLETVADVFNGCKNLTDIATGKAEINSYASIFAEYLEKLTTYYKEHIATVAYRDTTTGAISQTPKFPLFYQAYAGDLGFAAFKQDVEQKGTWPLAEIGDVFGADEQITFADVARSALHIEVKQKGLLADCINLYSAERLFANCYGLKGSIPADIFACSGNNRFNGLTSIAGMFEYCHYLTLYAAPTGGTNGTTVTSSSIFTDESFDTITGGGNYSTIYPSVKLTLPAGCTEITADTICTRELDREFYTPCYFVPEDWLEKCPNLTNISRLFLNVGTPLKSDSADTNKLKNVLTLETTSSSATYTLSFLQIPNMLFRAQNAITNASHAFELISTTGATFLNNSFLANSAATLQDISSIFRGSKIAALKDNLIENSVVFETEGTNTILNNVQNSFYGTNRITVVASDSKNSFKDWEGRIIDFTKPEYSQYLHVRNSTGLIYDRQAGDAADKCSAPSFYDTINKFPGITNFTSAFTWSNVQPYYLANGNINTNIDSAFTHTANNAVSQFEGGTLNIGNSGLYVWTSLYSSLAASQLFFNTYVNKFQSAV